jgi:nitroreductase
MTVLNWVLANPLTAVLILFLACAAVIMVTAYAQGREVSLFPPRIGGRRYRLPETGDAAGGIQDAIRLRKSVRSYTGQKVEPQKLDKLMESARLAPSASNRQEWRFVIVDGKETLDRIAQASCIRVFLKDVPCVIIACAEKTGHVMPGGQLSYPIDVAIALDHISLAAVELGLGTCWIGIYDEAKVKEIAGIPAEVRVVALMALGYPKDPTAEEKKRLPLEKIIKHNHW